MSEDNDILLENIIMKFLYTDKKLRDKIIPYLRFSIFEEIENVELIKFIKKFMNKYNKFPSVKETRLKIRNVDVYKHLKRLIKMDTSEYSTEMIIDMTEEFIKQKCIMDVCYKVVEHVNNDDDIDTISFAPDEMREALAFSFDNTVGLDIFDEYSEDLIYEQLHNKDIVVSTGLETLDSLIEDGFHEKTLTLFMAETNMGKSLIMGSLATNNIFTGKKVLYITCEMSEFKIGERVLQNAFSMSSKDLKRLPRDKFGKAFKEARERLQGKFIVKEYPTGVASVNHIRNLMKELKLKLNFEPDIIYIDYIGIMSATHRSKSDNTYTIQKRITEEVRGLAVELSIPIVSAIQTNRTGMGQDELDLTNASDSIGTAFTADIMIGVTQPDMLRAVNKYRWTLIKNRYGANKVGVNIKVDYDKMRLSDDDVIIDEKDNDEDDTSKKSVEPIGKEKKHKKKSKIIRNSSSKIDA